MTTNLSHIFYVNYPYESVIVEQTISYIYLVH